MKKAELTDRTLNPKLEAIKAKYRNGVTDGIIREFTENDAGVQRLLGKVLK